MNKVIAWIAAIGALGWTGFIIYALVESSSNYYGVGFFAWVGRLSGEGRLWLLLSAPFLGSLLAGIIVGAIVIALSETIFKHLFKD